MCFLALSFMLFSKKTLPLHPESQLFGRHKACRRGLTPALGTSSRRSPLATEINFNYKLQYDQLTGN